MYVTLSSLTRTKWFFLLGVFAVGLPIDMRIDLPGQVLLSVSIWLALFYVLAGFKPHERVVLWACAIIATTGELFLSQLWGLYTYRLGNIPFFIPPGHCMLFILAIGMAPRVPKLAANVILGGAVVYAICVAALRIDTLAIPLLAFFAAVVINTPGHRPFYASTFLLALALEIYGTVLGNWVWVREVPMFPFVTTNPPGLVSAFYAVLDTLIACTALPLARRLNLLPLDGAVQAVRASAPATDAPEETCRFNNALRRKSAEPA